MTASKKLLTLIITFLFIAAAVPSQASDSSIAIEGLGFYLDMYTEHSFMVELSSECSFGGVYLNDILISELPSGAKSCRITLPEGTLKVPGDAVIRAEAEVDGTVVSAEKNIYIFAASDKKAVLNQDFSGAVEASEQIAQYYKADKYDPSIWNHSREFGYLLGFTNGISTTNLNVSFGGGFQGLDADDASFQLIHQAGASGTKNVYFENTFKKINGDEVTVDRGIVEVSYDVYMNQGDDAWITLQDQTLASNAFSVRGEYGKWSRINIIYDLDKDKYYVNGTENDLVTSAGNLMEALNYIRIRFYPKAGNTIAVDNMKIDWYIPVDTEFKVTSPSEGDSLTDDEITVAYSAFGASAVRAYIDGEPVAENTDVSTPTSTLTFTKPEFGRRVLKVVAEYPDGSTEEKVINIKVTGTVKFPLGTTSSDITNDFDDMENSVYESTDELTKFIKSYGGWKSDMPVKRIAGKAGYAPLFVAPVTGNPENRSVYLTGALKNGSSEIAISGRLVFDFEYMITTVCDEYRMFSYGLWGGNGYTLVSDGKLCGTDFVLNPNEWYHFRLIYDADTEVWDVYVNGDKLVDASPAVESPFVTGRTVSFSVVTGEKTQADTPAGFALDNVSVYNETYVNVD